MADVCLLQLCLLHARADNSAVVAGVGAGQLSQAASSTAVLEERLKENINTAACCLSSVSSKISISCHSTAGDWSAAATATPGVCMLTILPHIYHFASLSTPPAEAVYVQLQAASGLHA